MDRVALAGMLTALSRLLVDKPSIAEIGLNPVIATQDGLAPVDARIVIGAPAQ